MCCVMYTAVSTCVLYIGLCIEMDVVGKELAAHKEMVAELRKQLVEKENELQVTCSTCSIITCRVQVHVHVTVCACWCVWLPHCSDGMHVLVQCTCLCIC